MSWDCVMLYMIFQVHLKRSMHLWITFLRNKIILPPLLILLPSCDAFVKMIGEGGLHLRHFARFSSEPFSLVNINIKIQV